MASRSQPVPSTVHPDRLKRATEEAAAFDQFCRRYDIEACPEAVTLYLTTLLAQGLHGRQIRERLQRLDLARRLKGDQPWNRDRDVKTFLRGLYSERPVGERSGHYDPLYLDLVHAMVDACRTPTPDQTRALAAQSLQQAIGATVAGLTRLQWRDVTIRKTSVDVALTTKVGRGAETTTLHRLAAKPAASDCPVAMMRALKSLDGGYYVLGSDGAPIDAARLRNHLRQIESGDSTPAQIRDAALLLIGYAAGLRTNEALALRQCDVRPHDKGLVIAISGRERETAIPSVPDPVYDPATAWKTWLDLLEAHGLRNGDGLAFKATNFAVIFDKGLHQNGLNRLVHQRADEAGLAGRYVWTSLRTGMMRNAIRNDVRTYTIAAHADLASLTSVQRHERRETLLGTQSVASMLGL